MLRCGIWNFSDIAKRATGFDWDICVEPGSKQKATFFFANVGCISRTSDPKKQEAAFRFLNAMGSDPDIVKLRLNSQWELPVVADENLMAEYLKVTPPSNKAAVLKSMDYAVTPPALEEFSYAVEILNPLLTGLETTTLTAQELLDQAQSELESAIELK
jgi:multiple sugar transport system substrate-binding protein